MSTLTRGLLATSRIMIGLVFLGALADKTFGRGFSTTAARAWIPGGPPTSGVLSSSDVGPLTALFHALAGQPVIDQLFMLALLTVGVACLVVVGVGVGQPIAAVAGSLLLLGMWVAGWPMARFPLTGQASGSTNPLVDYHLIYALILTVVAALSGWLDLACGPMPARPRRGPSLGVAGVIRPGSA